MKNSKIAYQAVAVAAIGMTWILAGSSLMAEEKKAANWKVVIAPLSGPQTEVEFHESKRVELAQNQVVERPEIVLAEGEKEVTAGPAEASAEEKDSNAAWIVPQAVRSPSYYQVYDSIPFLRAEYDANPSYRHEATMELLFGKLRPMVIYKNAPRTAPSRPSYRLTYPYAGRPRLNYNFYYPRPTVYRAY